ncbi:MAG: FHA domain-containing protein [bacterium]
MTERDDERDGIEGVPSARTSQQTLTGVGDLPPPTPRERSKNAFSAHPMAASDDGFVDPLDEISELELADDMLLEESSVAEFEDEATQIGTMGEFEQDLKNDGMFAAFDKARASGLTGALSAGSIPAPQLPKPSVKPPAATSPQPAAPIAAPAPVPAAPAPSEMVVELSSEQLPFAATQALPRPIYNAAAPSVVDGDPPEEFEAMKTEMLSSPYESDAPVVKLHALDGPAAGQEFFVGNIRTTIGRGESNSAMVPDVAMSRQHFEIVKNPDESFTLYDLHSVNGTALNGTRIKEADLFHGDRIEAGKSVFQFLMHGQIAQPTRQRRLIPAMTATMSGGGFLASTDSRVGTVMASVHETRGLMKLSTLIIIVAGTMSAILLGVIVFLLWTGDTPDGPAPQALASQRYLQGVEAVRDHDWETAEALFVDAQKLDPQLDVTAQLERITRERNAKAAFDRAKEKFDKRAWDEAAKFAAEVPENTTYYNDAQAFLRRPQTLAIDQAYAKAQEQVTADDLEGARRQIQEILAQVPDHQGALDLQARIDQIETDRAREAELAAERAKVAAAPRPTSIDQFADVPNSKNPGSSSGRVVNFTEGFRLYKARKFDEASDYFNDQAANASGASADRAKKTATEIRTFKKLYADALSAWEAKDWKKADKLISQARRADSAVAGGRGYFDSELATKLADARGNLGLAAYQRGDYAAAYKHQRDAEKQDASNAVVKDLRSKLLVSARSFYIKAANARKSDPNEAAKLCRTIMAMIPDSEDTWKKAQKLLQEM